VSRRSAASFAARIRGVGDQARPGVASLGVRPTINGTEPLLEAHVFDWDGDLYGKRIEVEFVKKIRNEEKFPDLAALAQQISRDVSAARIILGIAERARVGVKL
jgi:riboflavin kinase/FMN adenylyltransferase